MNNSFKLDKLKNWKFLGAFLGIVGGIQFIIVTIIAMFFYPGGYSFFENFFSHLGFTKSANNGQPNTVSLILFIISMAIGAIFWIPFWLSLQTVFKDTKKSRYMSLLGAILGLISCPFLLLIALSPGNLVLELHLLVTRIFFLSFALAIMIFSIVILFNKEYENIFAYIGFTMAILLLLYMSIFLLNAAFQKITVYVLISWVIIQGYKLWKILE
jgi:hypothetical membrane protein